MMLQKYTVVCLNYTSLNELNFFSSYHFLMHFAHKVHQISMDLGFWFLERNQHLISLDCHDHDNLFCFSLKINLGEQNGANHSFNYNQCK